MAKTEYVDIEWPGGIADDGHNIEIPENPTIEWAIEQQKSTMGRFTWAFKPDSGAKVIVVSYVNYILHNGKYRVFLTHDKWGQMDQERHENIELVIK